jgi:glutamate-ammonia-ligase adenylyltransferase
MLEERAAGEGRDLKIGRGGLVDVEFAVQALQLWHGRTEESLRTPHILRGLTALHRAGRLDEEGYQALFDGYRYLRQLDRRLRLIFDRHGDKTGYSEREMRRAGANPAEAAEVCRRVAAAHDRLLDGL